MARKYEMKEYDIPYCPGCHSPYVEPRGICDTGDKFRCEKCGCEFVIIEPGKALTEEWEKEGFELLPPRPPVGHPDNLKRVKEIFWKLHEWRLKGRKG